MPNFMALLLGILEPIDQIGRTSWSGRLKDGWHDNSILHLYSAPEDWRSTAAVALKYNLTQSSKTLSEIKKAQSKIFETWMFKS